MADLILEMDNITKEFPGVRALDNVTFQVKKGEIHALVGENGAGKSTLMSVLSGIHPYGTYTGEIIYKGQHCRFKTIKDSEKTGMAIIHQELALTPFLSIAENIFLGNEQTRGRVIDWDKTNNRAKNLMETVGLKEDYRTPIKDIGVGKQQLVEIAKALGKDIELLILDEPTAALNEEESENLLKLLQRLNKERGLTCILISHKLGEVIKVADVITVIRDGKVIESLDNQNKDTQESRIIKGMVGREMVDRFPKHTSKVGEVGFEVKNWVAYDPMDEDKMIIDHVDMYVRKGEIVGLAGLMGAGRTEFAMSLFGKAYGKKISGEIYKDGKLLHLHSIEQAIDNGISYVTEDRKNAGLILINDIKSNITLASLKRTSKNGILNEDEEVKVAKEYREKLDIKCSSIYQNAMNLSGGNQQKVVLAKWIASLPDVLLLDEPTRGIDVGAKYEIYNIINQLADSGKCVVMISSELPEILGVTDRIYIMNRGKMVGEMSTKEASQVAIMSCILKSVSENRGN